MGTGSLRLLPTADPVLSLVRDHPEQPLWGVFNLAAHSVTQHAPEADLRPVAAGLTDCSVRQGQLSLPPYGVALLGRPQ